MGPGLIWNVSFGQVFTSLYPAAASSTTRGNSIIHPGLKGDGNARHVHSTVPAGNTGCWLLAPSVSLFEASIPEGPSLGPPSPAVLFLGLILKVFSVST